MRRIAKLLGGLEDPVSGRLAHSDGAVALGIEGNRHRGHRGSGQLCNVSNRNCHFCTLTPESDKAVYLTPISLFWVENIQQAEFS
jgi:hypothetical protein